MTAAPAEGRSLAHRRRRVPLSAVVEPLVSGPPAAVEREVVFVVIVVLILR
ncbi:hypothetical protein [Streptomyces sp. NP160]|uniref:hypothetical protein n=1 Tax=Streptomyces sp. NP160 TaxID=2586637 RepID=UPI0015D5F60B|nr:hypothetical protein [Streptomyces sp. NP160]